MTGPRLNKFCRAGQHLRNAYQMQPDAHRMQMGSRACQPNISKSVTTESGQSFGPVGQQMTALMDSFVQLHCIWLGDVPVTATPPLRPGAHHQQRRQPKGGHRQSRYKMICKCS